MNRSFTIIHRTTQCWLFAGMATLLAIATGCSEDTSIRTYSVAKNESRGSRTTATSTLTQSAKDELMLGAIVPNNDVVWFFKLTGDPEGVTKIIAPFRSTVESIEFDSSGQPSWKLADGWIQQLTPNDMVYGKLTHSESGLFATVLRLPVVSEPTEEGWQGYVVQNINRWRGQLSLPEQTWREIADSMEELPGLSQGTNTAYFVSLLGKKSSSGGMGPFMNMSSQTEPAPRESSASPVAEPPSPQAASNLDNSEKPISYRVPEGWIETPASGMRMAAFDVADGASTGEVTVIAAGGEIGANISIWLGQVGAESTEESKQLVLQAAEEIAANETTAKLYTIEGSAPTTVGDSGEAPNSILIVDIPWREGQSLFVKFKGPSTLAVRQREKFVDFVESIEWK